MSLGFFNEGIQEELRVVLVVAGFATIGAVVINAISASRDDEDVALMFWISLVLALITYAVGFLALNGAGHVVLPDWLVTTCIATLILVAVLVIFAVVATLAGAGRRSSR